MAKSIRNPMSKADVIREIAEENGYTQADVRAILDAYKDIVTRSVQKGGVGEFKILDLVKVERVQRKARMARNPQTGEQVKVPAKRAVKAKPLGALKSIEL